MDGDACSFEHYVNCLNLPQYLNFGAHRNGRMVAVITLERIDRVTVFFHVAKMPRSITPQELAELLGRIGDYLFANGFETARAAIPVSNRAAARLAMRCGMREVDQRDSDRIFQITRQERHGQFKTSDRPRSI